MNTFQSQILSQISERIRLSTFKPIACTNEGFRLRCRHVFSENLSARIKKQIPGACFIQNKSNTLFLDKFLVQPLYNEFDFVHINILYIVLNTSNNTRLFTSTNLTKAQNYIKQLSIDGVKTNFKIITRYSYSDKAKSHIDTTYQDIPWKDTFNGVRRGLRFLNSPRSILEEYLRWCGCPKSKILNLLEYSIQIVLPFFNALKMKIHHNINDLPPEFRYFLDIPTIAGFPKMDQRQMTDDPYLWLTDVTHSQFDENWWQSQFRITFGQSSVKVPDALLTIKEFAMSPWLWVTEGATNQSKLIINGELVKTKFGAAVSRPLDYFYDSVLAAVRHAHSPFSQIGVFIKPDEKGYKRRLIANVPLGGYILAAYIRYLITSFTGDYPAFCNLSPTTEQIYDVFHLLKQEREFYPLDESAYDYNVSRESWDGFFRFLRNQFPENEGVALFKRYFDIAIWSFDGKEGKWLAGMPSGLALTSFLNSWMNYIKQMTIVPGHINWAAGDDVLAVPYSQPTLEEVSKDYAAFGSVSNPIKNWTSNRYCEYLKRLYHKTGTSGYPARIWASIIWAGTERFFLPADKLAELYELFKQFFDRLGIHMPETYVAADLSRSVSNKVPGFSIAIALLYLHSPRVHGGAGRLPYNNVTFTWTVENKHFDKIENNRIRIPRNIRYSGRVELKIGSYTLSPHVSFRFGNPYRLLPITNETEWEKRLNREDISYHGPFQHLILDVIPLPSLDFISTAMTSQIAADKKFNAYPNLHGSWQACSTRLIRGSLLLVDHIQSDMVNENIVTLI